MISDKYPMTCMHKECAGRSVPATWKYISSKWGTSYYCTNHAWRRGYGKKDSFGTWVQLTPNQRPVSVKE